MTKQTMLAAQSFGGRPLSAYARIFRTDGVVHIPGVLARRDLELIERAYTWKMQNAGAQGLEFYEGSGSRFFQANGDSSAEPEFREMLRESSIGDVVATVFAGGPVWYLEEQLFYKSGGAAEEGARRTPWHQDISYEPMTGEKSAVVWIGLDPIEREYALEVVRGSHKGIIYNATRFDPDDDTAPFHEHRALPRLPDIQAARERWDIVSWPNEPGDVLIFHPAALHGGGGTRSGCIRRSLTLRFVGDDARKMEFPRTVMPEPAPGEPAMRTSVGHLDRFWALPVGAPIADACVTRVRP